MRWLLAIVLGAGALLPLQAAEYYVRTNGSDIADGLSIGTAWRTVQKAANTAGSGDVVDIGPGDFAESIQLTRTNALYISSSNAIIRQMRFDAPSNRVSGITSQYACMASNLLWDSAFYVRPEGSWTMFTNCNVRDIPYAISSNWTFDATTDTISAPDVNLLSLGFSNGCRIYWGGVSYATNFPGYEWRYVNMGRSAVARNVTATTFTVDDGVLDSETNNLAFSIIQAGSLPYNMNAFKFVTEGIGTSYPTNCVITGCTISNMFGVPISTGGGNLVVSNCTIMDAHGGSGIEFPGFNLTFVSNLFFRCQAKVYYSYNEHQSGAVSHNEGEGLYDYVHAFLIRPSQNTAFCTNVLFQGNWFEWIEQPLGNFSRLNSNTFGIKMLGNVFVGVKGIADGGSDDLQWDSNTFYRCAFEEGNRYVAVLGGSAPPITNFFFRNNLLAGCGDHQQHTNEGYWQITNTNAPMGISNNFVTGLEIAGWNAMTDFPASWGINGGDPKFVNPWLPRGLDGIPFTKDDGLRLRPGSPAAGIGALSVVTPSASEPLAYFDASIAIAPGYYDAKGSNYSPAWQGQLSFIRTNWARPYTTADPWTNLPQQVTFHATNSISGGWNTNDWVGIKWFRWEVVYPFTTVSVLTPANVPEFTHTFLIDGQVTLSLTITNWEGNVATHAKSFRVLPGTNFAGVLRYVSTSGNDTNAGTYESPWATITNAVAQAGAGDFVGVLPGSYPRDIDMSDLEASNGTANAWITMVGYNAHLPRLNWERNYWAWEGFANSPTNAGVGFFGQVTGGKLVNWWFHDGGEAIDPISAQKQYGPTTNVTIRNCLFTDLWPSDGIIIGDWNYTTVDGNVCIRIKGEADFFRDSGHSNWITRNYLTLMGYANADHPDFIANNNTDAFSGWTVEGNWLYEPYATNVYSLGNCGTGGGGSSKIRYRNNVFIGIYAGANPLGGNDPEIHNNTFYHLLAAAAIATGGSAGAITNIDARNNAYVECGTGSTGDGWYGNQIGTPGQDSATNSTFLFADYNYVGGTNGAAKDAGGTNQAFRFGTFRDYNGVSLQLEPNGVNGGLPRFVDAPNGDFRPDAESPLAGAGADLSSFFTTDYFRKVRTVWDIGAVRGLAAAAAAGSGGSSVGGSAQIGGSASMR